MTGSIRIYNRVFCAAIFCWGIAGAAWADTIYLKNGRSLEGIVKKQTAQNLELEVGFGVVTFGLPEIVRVEKSNHQQTEKILQRWQEQKRQVEEVQRINKSEPVVPVIKNLNTIECPLEGPHILMQALINWSVSVPLMLDTGASFVILSKTTGDKLNIDTRQPKMLVQLQIGDGTKINAAYVVLKNINIQGVEVSDVDAAVLLEDRGTFAYADGVLGMSFLSRFNMKVDRKEKKFILEKI
ncbi:MAG TPA: retropepsin-like aspartic protease [Candidatus Omnitrophota bacterium]|nr:retropepsin-like aspartic protease [Candidatus Omnitrophota bacterium]